MTALQAKGTCICRMTLLCSVGHLKLPPVYRRSSRQIALGQSLWVLYSDGCGGQNKNLTIIGLYSELHHNGIYDVIHHKFLARGHTFMRNDKDFMQIEKRKPSTTVHIPEDWCQVVRGQKVESIRSDFYKPGRLKELQKNSWPTGIPTDKLHLAE